MYIPLYNKSNYSLLSSLLTIDDIISFAIKNNMQSIAISDTNMYGTMEFIKKCENPPKSHLENVWISLKSHLISV